MGRVAGLANAIRNSGARLGPLDVAFAGLDYYDGKQQGEDDIRAAAGAAGSTLGGWGGAAAGAATGAAIGSVVPIVGTAIGGAAGALIGGTAGGFLGGWGADRADELIRGNKKDMATFYDAYGNSQKQDTSFSDLGNLAAAGMLGYAGLQGGRSIAGSMRGVDPVGNYNLYKNAGNSTREAVMNAGADTLSMAGRSVRQGLRNMPGPAKVLGAIGAGVVANNMLGNPIGKGIDTITGNATNFDGDQLNSQRQMAARQVNDIRDQNAVTLEALKSNPYYQLQQQMSDENERRTLARQDFEWQRNNAYAEKIADRATKEQRISGMLDLQASQARDLMNAYTNSIPNSVANSMRTVWGARYI